MPPATACSISPTPTRTQVEVWSNDGALRTVRRRQDPRELVGQLSDRFGRQPPLARLGDRRGDRRAEGRRATASSGSKRSSTRAPRSPALWCEDWAGVRETSFGRRLFWDWRRAQRSAFPTCPQRIAGLARRGIRFLAYANPYLANDGILYETARELGHFCLRPDSDEVYLVDFGEFDCGVVDFTRAETRAWFAERVLGARNARHRHCRLDGRFRRVPAHRRPPRRRQRSDGSAQPLAGAVGRGQRRRRSKAAARPATRCSSCAPDFPGVQAHCPLLWAGDQSVDFTRHDGIGTVITAALSAGLVGNAYSHSDCGGYTSLLGNVRTVELMQRWCELAAFAPVMRSHEGNRPDDNLQYDSTPELLACFARWSRVHAALAPYVRTLCDEAAETGLPLQRPLFLELSRRSGAVCGAGPVSLRTRTDGGPGDRGRRGGAHGDPAGRRAVAARLDRRGLRPRHAHRRRADRPSAGVLPPRQCASPRCSQPCRRRSPHERPRRTSAMSPRAPGWR